MIIRNQDRSTQRVEHMREGDGYVLSTPILPPETMYSKCRLFSHIVLEKNCEVGWHVHQGDGEAYYIIKGSGEYSDNGTMITLNTGDAAFCFEGEGHSIKNISDEPMEMIALIIYSGCK